MHTIVAWGEDADRSTLIEGLAAISDDDVVVTTSDTIQLPATYPFIAAIICGTEFLAYQWVKGKITAPSITQRPLLLSRGFYGGVESRLGTLYDFRHNPLNTIKPGDYMTASSVEEDEAGVSHKNMIAMILSDGIIPEGKSRHNILHRCTVGAITTALTWQVLALTEESALESGEYEMYGADVVSASVIAARFVFPGNNKVGRPAVIARRREDQGIHPFSEYWGTPIRFKIPGGLPKLNMLCETTDTADHVTLLLKKVG